MTTAQLKEKLRDAMSESARGTHPLSEQEALETALDFASEWQIRFEEIQEENES